MQALEAMERLMLAIAANGAVSPALRGRARDLHLRLRFLRETGLGLAGGDRPSPWARPEEA